MDLKSISRSLSSRCETVSIGAPVTHVYNPLAYARTTHEMYLKRYGGAPKEVLFLGMNPGPWGMAQTGVPFGEVSLVRDWMGIEGRVSAPPAPHPKRPVTGFDCARSEVSGRRLWGWARDRFNTPDAFFDRFFVWNYCPLAFMVESGRNFTPDKLPAEVREELFAHCNDALGKLVSVLEPQWVIGVGKFAEARAHEALVGFDGNIGTVLHPSPASPAANRDWVGQAEKRLTAYGIL